MKTTTENMHAKLVKKFHTLLSKYSINNEDKRIILSSYGVISSTDLAISDLAQVCDSIESKFGQTAENKELDKLRKRLIASIYAWRESMGVPTSMNEVKAIACRAAEVPEGYAVSIRFNTIPKEKLRSLYSCFRRQAKDMSKVKEMTSDMIDKLTILN